MSSDTLTPAYRLTPGDEFLYAGTWHTVTSISGASSGGLHIRCGDESFVADAGAARHARKPSPAAEKAPAESGAA